MSFFRDLPNLLLISRHIFSINLIAPLKLLEKVTRVYMFRRIILQYGWVAFAPHLPFSQSYNHFLLSFQLSPSGLMIRLVLSVLINLQD